MRRGKRGTGAALGSHQGHSPALAAMFGHTEMLSEARKHTGSAQEGLRPQHRGMTDGTSCLCFLRVEGWGRLIASCSACCYAVRACCKKIMLFFSLSFLFLFFFFSELSLEIRHTWEVCKREIFAVSDVHAVEPGPLLLPRSPGPGSRAVPCGTLICVG